MKLWFFFLLFLCFGCERERLACDVSTVASKKVEAAKRCQLRGYDWEECPERAAIFAELEKELNQCSR